MIFISQLARRFPEIISSRYFQKFAILIFGALPLTALITVEIFLLGAYWDDMFTRGPYALSTFIYVSSILGFYGVWLSVLPDRWLHFFGRYTNIFKGFGFAVLAIIYWIIGLFICREIASEYTAFLALNITNSSVYGGFEWDADLKIASYISYVFLFSVALGVLLKGVKKDNHKNLNRLVSLPFIFIFPSFTNWRVDCTSACGSSMSNYELIVPVILSTKPVFILISIALAYMLSKLYAMIRQAEF